MHDLHTFTSRSTLLIFAFPPPPQDHPLARPSETAVLRLLRRSGAHHYPTSTRRRVYGIRRRGQQCSERWCLHRVVGSGGSARRVAGGDPTHAAVSRRR